MKVLLLITLTFLLYWGLAVVMYQDFTFRLTLGENAETGRMVFYILPWMMITLAMLLPMLGVLATMRRWLMEKAWRKVLAGLLLAIQIGLITLISNQLAQQGEISFKPWKPSPPEQAVLAADEPTKDVAVPSTDETVELTINGATEETFQASIEKIKASLSGDEKRAFEEAIDSTTLVLKEDARNALNGKSAQAIIEEAKPLAWLGESERFSATIERQNQFKRGYSRFIEALKRLDADVGSLSEVLRERIEASRLNLSDADSVTAKWKEFEALLHGTVKQRIEYVESQEVKLMAIDETNLSENQKWLSDYSKELDEATTHIDGYTNAVEMEIIRVQQLMSK